MKIIYEDAEKLIVEKPAGMLTQSARSFDTDLVSEVLTYRRSKKETAYAAVINRLDRPVGGLVLFAKTKQAAARLSKQMQQDTLNKQYYALICGKPEQSKGMFVDYLQKDAKANVSKVVSKESKEAKRAELEYEVLKTMYAGEGENEPVTLLKIICLPEDITRYGCSLLPAVCRYWATRNMADRQKQTAGWLYKKAENR